MPFEPVSIFKELHAYFSPTTILKIFHRLRVGSVSLKNYRPGPKPADAPLQVPGRSVQLGVKFVLLLEVVMTVFLQICPGAEMCSARAGNQ